MLKVASVYAVTQRNRVRARDRGGLPGADRGRHAAAPHPDEILINFLNEWEKIQAEYAAKDPFYKKVIDSQRKYAELVVPFRLSWYPPYDFAGNYYWKDKVYLKK
jgi:TRAP-type mannitol/chloroaromatic compound transport system substrate-binding protein